MLYPQLNKSRILIDLNGIWDFKLDDGEGFSNEWYKNELDEPMSMAVPGSYNDQKESQEIRDHCGWVFYQRKFSVPSFAKDQRIVLRFGAVTHYAKVYLNGELIVEHSGGFLPFEAEIQDKISDCDNLITVAVDNSINHSTLPVGNEEGSAMFSGMSEQGGAKEKKNIPNFDFFNYAGIIRPVKIYTTPKKFINDIIVLSDIEGENGKVSYKIDTVGDGSPKLEIYSQENELVASAVGNEGTVTINNVNLWNPNSSYLYTAKVTFGNDFYKLKFGVRTVKVDGGKFLINGKPFYFKGFGKHEDSNYHGRGLDEVLNVKDLALFKWMSANSFRTSHYPYSEEMMMLCDREGIVVIDETPAVGIHKNFSISGQGSAVDTYEIVNTEKAHRQVIKDLIARDKNHPCVVMWSIANEPDTAISSDSALKYFKPLYDLAHDEDPQSRPVTVVSAMTGSYLNDKTLPMMDVICINRYYGWYVFGGDLEQAKAMLAKELDYWEKVGKPVMFTEYGADTIAGFHALLPTMFSEEYQVEYLKANNEVIDRYSFFIGEHVWNFADFKTSQGIIRVDGNKKGIFTRERNPKMAAHYLKDRWEKVPDFDYKP